MDPTIYTTHYSEERDIIYQISNFMYNINSDNY